MYHGLELLLKAILSYIKIDFGKIHNTRNLIDKLDGRDNIPDEFVELSRKYVGNSPTNRVIREFLLNNDGLRASNIHVDIRYPDARCQDSMDFSSLEYNEETIIEDIKEIIHDIDVLYSLSSY